MIGGVEKRSRQTCRYEGRHGYVMGTKKSMADAACRPKLQDLCPYTASASPPAHPGRIPSHPDTRSPSCFLTLLFHFSFNTLNHLLTTTTTVVYPGFSALPDASSLTYVCPAPLSLSSRPSPALFLYLRPHPYLLQTFCRHSLTLLNRARRL